MRVIFIFSFLVLNIILWHPSSPLSPFFEAEAVQFQIGDCIEWVEDVEKWEKPFKITYKIIDKGEKSYHVLIYDSTWYEVSSFNTLSFSGALKYNKIDCPK